MLGTGNAADLTSLPFLVSASSGLTSLNRFFVEDYASIQLAFNAACAANGVLMLPPGITQLPAGGLVLPNSFVGTNAAPANVSIIGCGKNVSILAQANASAGVNLVPYSPGTPAGSNQPGNTFINLQGFTVVSNNASCTTGIVVDYGTAGVSNQTNGGNCSFRDLSVREGTGTWNTQAFYFRNVWYSCFDNVSGLGSYYNGGTTGAGLTFDSCINPLVTNVSLEGYTIGINVPTGTASVGDSQGVNLTNIRIIQCKTGFYFVAMNFWVSNFMIDNGNNFMDGTIAVNFQGGGLGNESCLQNGQILQNGGQYVIELNNCAKIMLQNLGLTYLANAPTWVTMTTYNAGQFVQDPGAGGATYKCILGVTSSTQPHSDATHWASAPNNGLTAEVWLTNLTSLCSVQACMFAGSITAILADSGTSGTKAFNNIDGSGHYTDNGSNTLTS